MTVSNTVTDNKVVGNSQAESSGFCVVPTEHDIQYVDELDFADNLGSLLGSADWCTF